MVAEATVGAHREMLASSGSAHARHRLTQEVGGAAGGVGAALAQPPHQHVTRPGRHREQRVIAARTVVAGWRAERRCSGWGCWENELLSKRETSPLVRQETTSAVQNSMLPISQ